MNNSLGKAKSEGGNFMGHQLSIYLLNYLFVCLNQFLYYFYGVSYTL